MNENQDHKEQESVLTDLEENQNAEEVEEVATQEPVVEEIEEVEIQEIDKASEYLERLQRLMAEFDNYRKRSQKEKSDAYDYAVGNTIVELLPIVDNFERALKIESTDKALYDGIMMIYKQLLGFLEKVNVLPIEAKDQIFDPKLHNAILHIEDENLGENVIVEELQKGYLYKEKVIRHSMVKVAN